MTTLVYRFKFRGRTAASWITNEGLGEILLDKEGGYETDTGKMKIGDGVTGWSSLRYFDPTLHATATGTGNAITATYDSKPVLYDGLTLALRASAANTAAATFAPNGLTARAITKFGGTALSASDIAGAGHELLLRYVASVPRWELLNPAASGGQASIQFKDEGVNVGAAGAITQIDFTGADVSAAVVGTILTITVTSGGGAPTYGLVAQIPNIPLFL